MEKFKGILNPTDIHMFLVFSNKEGINILDYLMKEMNRFLRGFGVNLEDFKKIIDLREL